MTGYQVLCLIGVPSISVTIFGILFGYIKKSVDDNKALKEGLQVILRKEMINEYRRACDKGYATIEEREQFEAMWKQYHTLGANGVMDDIHDKYHILPHN